MCSAALPFVYHIALTCLYNAVTAAEFFGVMFPPRLAVLLPVPLCPCVHAAGAFEAVNKLSPHIYLVAGAAYRDMVRQNTSQSLVINGESGAGKTETTKKAMQFFAKLAGGTGVEDQVLEVSE